MQITGSIVKISTIIEYGEYQFINYTVLDNKGRKIALDFRDKGK